MYIAISFTNTIARNPAKLCNKSQGFITLSYIPIDKTLRHDEIFDYNQRYPVFSPYPWYSNNYVVANIEQETIEDAVGSIITNGAKKYRTYKVNATPGSFIEPQTSCFNETSPPYTQIIKLQISPQSLLTTWRKSGYGINRGTIILNEGAIVGGVMLLQFFLALYET